MPSRTIEEQFDRVEEFNSLLGAAELNAATPVGTAANDSPSRRNHR